MKYKIILFDADQTLFDFKKCEYEALKKALVKLGLRNDDECIARYSEINDSLWKKLELGKIEKSRLVIERFERLCNEYGFECSVNELSDSYREYLSNEAYLIDGATDILDFLVHKCRLFVITNGLKQVQEGRFERSGIKKYFENIFISEEIGAEKPSKMFFDNVKSRIDGFEDRKALVVGDSLTSDIKGGINAGIDTCWFDPDRNDAPDDMKIDHIIYDLAQLKEII